MAYGFMLDLDEIVCFTEIYKNQSSINNNLMAHLAKNGSLRSTGYDDINYLILADNSSYLAADCSVGLIKKLNSGFHYEILTPRIIKKPSNY